MSSNYPTYADFWKDVRSDADEIVSRNVGDADPNDFHPEDFYDDIHIDADNAVIYTSTALDILRWGNHDAWRDHLSDTGDLGENPIEIMAFYAYREALEEAVADVLREVQSEWEEPDDDDDDEKEVDDG
jgi:hypothetical protein